jgi:hypothetical protein
LFPFLFTAPSFKAWRGFLLGGNGNISLNASTFTQTLLANTGGNTAASQVTDANLTGNVIYTYTVVPEPSTFGLLALGLSALPLLRRQRQ